MRTLGSTYTNTSSSINSGVPSAAEVSKYFYLPALGYYDDGELRNIGHFGDCGYYWSSSAYPSGSGSAYYLYILNGTVCVYGGYRYDGYRVDGFE